MDTVSLPELIRSAGQRMRHDLAGRLVPHKGELGAAREEIIRQFLREYLPKRFEISTGFVFDCHGRVSEQQDIIIANSFVSPRFEVAGGTRFYPVESVVAVGQIKSEMTSKGEFTSALKNIESVKALDRSADGKACDSTMLETLDHIGNYLHQVFGFVFVTGKSLAEKSAHSFFLEQILHKPAHTWPNLVFALDQYLVTYCCDDGVCPNPMHARGVAAQSANAEFEILMKFYLLTAGAIEATRVGSFPYWTYLRDINGWNATVYYSTTDDPPPYLSQISAG